MATHSSILAWRIPWAEGASQTMVHGVTESDTTERLTLSFTGDNIPSGCKLKHLLFERAQSAKLEEVRLSLDVDENTDFKEEEFDKVEITQTSFPDQVK